VQQRCIVYAVLDSTWSSVCALLLLLLLLLLLQGS
jgi:hypothetical protein